MQALFFALEIQINSVNLTALIATAAARGHFFSEKIKLDIPYELPSKSPKIQIKKQKKKQQIKNKNIFQSVASCSLLSTLRIKTFFMLDFKLIFLITKTHLFKYAENFTTKKMKIFR